VDRRSGIMEADGEIGEDCQKGSEVHDAPMKRWLMLLGAFAVLNIVPVLTGCKKAESTSESVTQYTCAHHPEVVQSTPGKCPKCNMDLTPKK